MEGDALSVLDCCMASTAALKGKTDIQRVYQLLAASSVDAPTCGPGQNSFTTALCDSLEELLTEADGGMFLLTQLCERINTKRKNQACLSWDRLRTFKRTVQLGRLDQTQERDVSFRNEAPEQASLVLRFSLATYDLNNNQIEALGEQLPRVCREAQIPLRRIDWMGMKRTDRPSARLSRRDAFVRAGDRRALQTQNNNSLESYDDEVSEAENADGYKGLRALNVMQRWRIATLRKSDS
jgi:hypothetical protein